MSTDPRATRSSPFVIVLGLAALVAACGSDGERRSTAEDRAVVVVEPIYGAADEGAAAERLRADVAWLADDAREGRRAGTEGAKVSGEWIAARFRELGLEPAGGGFLQEFNVPMPVVLGPGTRVEMHRLEVPGKDETISGAADVVPLSGSSGGEAGGELAWRGYGIVDAALGWNDYPQRCDGKVAIVVRGTPPERYAPAPQPAQGAKSENVEQGAGWGNAGSLMMKAVQAKHQGAVAMLVVPHPDRPDEPLPPFEDGGAVAGIPVLALSHEAATRLFEEYHELAVDRTTQQMTEWPTVRVVADVTRSKGPAQNVLARLRGERSDRCVVIGAHYDHLGRGGEGSLAPERLGEIHNGADDNASGTAVVLEVARALAAGPKPPCDVVFALWSGEELGLLGSEHWAQMPTVPLSSVIANVNLDMVGRAGSGALEVLGAGTAEPFAAWLAELGPRVGLELKVSASGQGVGGSDHHTFSKRKIPALHLFSGLHPDYHKPSDDLERFEAGGAAKVASLAAELVRRSAASAPLAWIEPPAPDAASMRTRGFNVYFGSMPEYSFEGPGIRLSGTSAGSPAEKAGLVAGDVIVQVGDIEVEGMGDYMLALTTYKPGDVVLTRFLRGGEEQSVRVTLAAPKRERQ